MTKEPSKIAFEQASLLGRTAAKSDQWMTPCPEEHTEDSDDLGEISQAHRESWEETTHFQVNYRTPLFDLAEEDSGIESPYSASDFYESHFIPLKDAFWDAWEEESNFYQLAQKLLGNG